MQRYRKGNTWCLSKFISEKGLLIVGLFNFLKKKSDKVKVPIPTSKVQDTINFNSAISGNKNISPAIRLDAVPSEVFKLLWFVDGPFKNYTNSAKDKSTINVGGFTIWGNRVHIPVMYKRNILKICW